MLNCKRLVLLLVLWVAASAAAQQPYMPNSFHGLESEGEIPADLKKSLRELYNEDKQRMRDYNDGRLKNRDMVLAVSYNINRLTSNGRILYGDPITKTIERIADTLLKDYPELRGQLRFYTVKSASVNAFATGQGMIFVNLGLVAQVENEAQLAFVIGHEIIHYYRKHTWEEMSRKRQRASSPEQQMQHFLRYHHRSREMENEADSLGLTLFYINSPYDKRVSEGIFDVLQFADQPFGQVEITRQLFDSPYYKLPDSYFLDQVTPVTPRDYYNDTLSTHPDLQSRRKHTSHILQGAQGGEAYVLTTPEQFEQLRMLARMECIRQDLIYGQYTRAYYNCLVLLQQYADNPFLISAKAQALYGLAKQKTYTGTMAVEHYEAFEGEIQQLYHLFGKLKADEASLLAMRELWAAHKKLPTDGYIDHMCQDMLQLLYSKHAMKPNDFSATFDTAASRPATDSSSTPEGKYARFKQKQHTASSTFNPKYAFTDLLQQDTAFSRWLNQYMTAANPAKVGPSSDKGVFLFAPGYFVTDLKDGGIKYRKSDHQEELLPTMVAQAAKGNNLTTTDFSDPTLRQHSDAQFYNDFVALNEWTNEFWQTRGAVPKCMATQPQMDQLIARYGDDKLSLNMVANAEYYQKVSALTGIGAMMFGTMLFPLMPLTINFLASNKEMTTTYNYFIDTRSGRVLDKNDNIINYRDSKALVTNSIYSNIYKGMNGRAPIGYMGKRLSVSVNGALDFPFLKLLYFDRISRAVEFRPALNVEYTLNKTKSVSLWCDYLPTRMWVESNPDELIANMTDLFLTWRHYLNGNTAPLGPYWGFGATLSHVALSTQEQANGSQLALRYLKNHYLIPGLQIEFGRNYIFGNKIVFNYGARYTLTLANPIKPEWNNTNIGSTSRLEMYETRTRRSLYGNIWMTNLFVFSLGVGLLPL